MTSVPLSGTSAIRKIPKAAIAQPRPLFGIEQRWLVDAYANVDAGYETDLLAQDDEEGRIAGAFVLVGGRVGRRFSDAADHPFLQALRLRDVRQVRSTGPSAGSRMSGMIKSHIKVNEAIEGSAVRSFRICADRQSSHSRPRPVVAPNLMGPDGWRVAAMEDEPASQRRN